MTRLRAALLAAAVALLQACATAPVGPAGPDHAPDAVDEEGLWQVMAREEEQIRELPLRVRDPALQAYVDRLACRLAGDLCDDIRVYVLRLPYFNATMAPNGMMQLYTGLLLRCENEAQLASVLGHEISHYRMRHSLNNWRRTRRTADALLAFNLIGGIGNAGAVGYLLSAGVAGATLARFSREQEAEADAQSGALLAEQGIALQPAVALWQGARAEEEANPKGFLSAIFADHPATTARIAALQALAASAPAPPRGGRDPWGELWLRFAPVWLDDEIGRRNYQQSQALLARLQTFPAGGADVERARGDLLRLRGAPGDLEQAVIAYETALSRGAAPQTWRQLGLTLRRLKRQAEARAAFLRYLDAVPDAPDRALIESYR